MNLNTHFEQNENIQIINPQSIWRKKGNAFFNTYYLSILDNTSYLPKIQVNAIKYVDKNINAYEESINNSAVNNTNDATTRADLEQKIPIITGSAILENKNIRIYDIKWSKNYSKLITDNFKILDYKVERYDNNTNAIAILIKAKYANLYDFKINNKNIKNQKIKKLKSTLPDFKIIYYATIDKTIKAFKFNYFNPSKATFHYESLPVDLKQETISTQTNINPKNNNFTILKIIFMATLILIFIAFYIFQNNKLYLIPIFITSIVLIMTIIPFNTTILPKGTKIKILPIEKSTICSILDKDTEVKILQQKNGFLKVLFKNKVGWVNDKIINK